LIAELPALEAQLSTLQKDIQGEISAIKHFELSATRIEQGQNPLGEIYWQATDMDAAGNVTAFTLGNGVTTTRNYNTQTGFLETIQSTANGLGTFQNLAYTYNKLGMPTSREDKQSQLTESFEYDAQNLNRLAKSSITGRINQTTQYRYDSLGNITYKQDNNCGVAIDTSCYEYGARPHAVTKAAGIDYAYDAQGNMNMTSSSAGRLISWTHFNKPRTLLQSAQSDTEHNRSLSFDYDANHQRIRMVQVDNTEADNLSGVTKTTWSLGPGFQQIVKPGPVVENHQSIKVPGATILIVQLQNQDSTVKGESVSYLHHDNLGSTNVITGRDTANKVVLLERSHFGAFGSPLKDQSLNKAKTNSDYTNKGYTGHEMLNLFGLVHMNARLYDPALGRFISPDTFVQSMANTQAFNRYSYVLNNPLSYTDPSGHFFVALGWAYAAYKMYHWADTHRQEAAIITIVVLTGGTASALGAPLWAAGAIAGGVGGGVSAKLAGGSGNDVFRGAMMGAFIGGTTAGLAQVGAPPARSSYLGRREQ